MHATAMKHGALFFDTYLAGRKGLTILDIGAQDVNGSLRSVAPRDNNYVGVDFCEGKGVDVIIDDPYKLPFEDGYADACVSSSCFEHSEFFWLAFLEVVRITKPGGLIYLNVPSNGLVHRYPVDCWRFYPDSGLALQNWARRNGFELTQLESFVGGQASGYWNDFVAVFVRSNLATDAPHSRILDKLDAFTNGWRVDRDAPLREHALPEDQRGLFDRVRRFVKFKIGLPL